MLIKVSVTKQQALPLMLRLQTLTQMVSCHQNTVISGQHVNNLTIGSHPLHLGSLNYPRTPQAG